MIIISAVSLKVMFTSFSPLLRLFNSHVSIDVFFFWGGGETLGFRFRFRGGQFLAPGFNWNVVEGAGSYN